MSHLLIHITSHTCPTTNTDISNPQPTSPPLWNNPTLISTSPQQHDQNASGDNHRLPCLKAIILDCSSVDFVDVTSVQELVDARNVVRRHAGGRVGWYFVGLENRWARRALAVEGFGVEAHDYGGGGWGGRFYVDVEGAVAAALSGVGKVEQTARGESKGEKGAVGGVMEV